MLVDYIRQNHSDELVAIAEWTERLLPSSWLESIPHDVEKRIPYLLGRMLLCRRLRLLGYSYFNLPRMYYTPKGKPYFGEQLYFSVTSTTELIVLAFSERQEVGIGAEQIRPISWQSYISNFSRAEWRTIRKQKYPSKNLINYWVIKEAATQLIDETLDFSYSNIKFKKDKIQLNKTVYYCTELDLSSSCIAKIITQQPCKKPVINNITHQLASGLRIVRA